MGDFGIDPAKQPPLPEEIDRLHAKQAAFERMARITQLERGVVECRRDILQKTMDIEKLEAEITRLREELHSVLLPKAGLTQGMMEEVDHG